MKEFSLSLLNCLFNLFPILSILEQDLHEDKVLGQDSILLEAPEQKIHPYIAIEDKSQLHSHGQMIFVQF